MVNTNHLTQFEKDFADITYGYVSEHGLTTRAIAAKIGKSSPWVWERLAGQRSISLNLIVGLADMTGTSPSTLLSELNRRVMATRTYRR